MLPAAQVLETNPGLFVFASISALALFIRLLFTVFLSKRPTAMSIDTPEKESESMMDVDPVTTLPGMMNHDGMETVQLPGELLPNGSFSIRNIDMWEPFFPFRRNVVALTAVV